MSTNTFLLTSTEIEYLEESKRKDERSSTFFILLLLV